MFSLFTLQQTRGKFFALAHAFSVVLTFGGALATVGGLACFAQCYAP